MSVRMTWQSLAYSISMVLFTTTLSASEYLKPRELSLGVGKYTSDASRDVFIRSPENGSLAMKLDLTWNIDLACGYYPKICWVWDNTIHSKASQNRFRYVSWEFTNGLDFGRFQVLYYHHSQHLLDETANIYESLPAERQWPVEDAVYVKVFFIRNK